MSQTLIQRTKQTLVVHDLTEVKNNILDLRTNQVHSAITEIQLNTNDQLEDTNKQIWQTLINCQVQIVFDDWIYQNFYFEAVMSNGSGTGVNHTAEARGFDFINNAVFVGSTITTTSLNAPVQVRSGLLTKPAQTGTYHFEEEYGIDVAGQPDSFVNIYMGRYVIRYEGG